jgi:hypothetical protein
VRRCAIRYEIRTLAVLGRSGSGLGCRFGIRLLGLEALTLGGARRGGFLGPDARLVGLG